MPPPCVGCTTAEEPLKPPFAMMPKNAPVSTSSNWSEAPSSLRSISPEPTMSQPLSNALATEHPHINRHRSVSKRMLSSLKSAAARTRSSRIIRPMESESSLLRRMSGRRKPTNDQPPERRAYSFDVSRDSVASEADVASDGSPDAAEHKGQRLEHRSFTDSTVSTSALVQELDSVTPPFGTPTPNRVVLKHRFSSAPESPPPKHPVGFELTPRPFERIVQPTSEPIRNLMVVPCVRLDVTMGTTVIDSGEKKNIWVAIEARVETHVSDLPSEG